MRFPEKTREILAEKLFLTTFEKILNTYTNKKIYL
jgi:hypothetical protein